MKIWKIIKIIHKIIVKSLDILNIFHIFVIIKGNELNITDMTTIVAVTNRDMYRAAVISQRVQNDFVAGMQVAKLNELKARMRREVVKFAYLKKSGEVRIAYRTMMPALVGDHINGRGICGDALKLCPYFDVERGQFRCFQLHSLGKIF